MLPTSKRRAFLPSLPLPASSADRYPSSASIHRAYPYEDKDKHTLKRQRTTSHRKLIALLVVVIVVVAIALSFASALTPNEKRKVRTTRGSKVVARDWGHALRTKAQGSGGALVDQDGTVTPARTYNQTVLILCPMRNAIEHIWHFFHLVDSLTYPRHLVHLAILVSDTSDGTYPRALELADERQYGRQYRGGRGRYGRISVYQKDFAADQAAADDDDLSSYAGANVGSERHAYEAQVGRRKLLGKSRTWLLTSSLEPEIDWVLWADVDLVDYEPTLIERLMAYADGSSPGSSSKDATGADVVVPNCVWKTYNEMGAYDRNNWVETPESLAMKAALPADQVLIEGYKDHPTYRFNLASLAPSHPSQLSPHNPYLANPSLLTLSSLLPSYPPPDLTLPSALLDPSTTTTTAVPVPETLDLDGVGGCAALVRAEVHREGAIFPAWPPVDHQLETEGFAQMVKALRRGRGGRGRGRGRLLGLPRYYVYHGLYG